MEACTYPLTGRRVVDRIYTDVAVIDITEDGFMVREKLTGLSADQLNDMTGADLTIAENCAELKAPEL